MTQEERMQELMNNEDISTQILNALVVLSTVCKEIKSDSFSIVLQLDNVNWRTEFKILSSEKVEETCNTVN